MVPVKFKEMLRDLFKDMWNVPNTLTIMRLVLVPVFVGEYLCGHTVWALVIFCLASLTDCLDGYLARKNKQITNFGKLFDPLADKLLVLSALVCHVIRGVFPWPALLIIGLKEILMVAGSILILNRGVVVQSNIFGKTATCAFMAALILGFFHQEFQQAGFPIDTVMLWIAVVASLLAIAVYTKESWRHLFPKKAEK